MKTVFCNFTIYRGTVFTFAFQWKENGVAIDLTTWGAKSSFTVDETTVTVTSDTNQLVLGSDGWVTYNVPEAVTLLLPVGTGLCDIIFYDPNGNTMPPIVAAVVTVKDSVTSP